MPSVAVHYVCAHFFCSAAWEEKDLGGREKRYVESQTMSYHATPLPAQKTSFILATTTRGEQNHPSQDIQTDRQQTNKKKKKKTAEPVNQNGN